MKKRKTHTSTAVKRRYNDKSYDRISYSEKKEIAEAFKSKCAEKGIPQAQILKKAVHDFLEE